MMFKNRKCILNSSQEHENEYCCVGIFNKLNINILFYSQQIYL